MIKIQNVYYMLSYAFQTLQEQGYKNVAAEQFDNVAELCAAILIKGVNLQIKRGLRREYISKTDTVTGIRGRINISESIKTQSMLRKQMVCTYDDFSVNTYMNQIIKTTMIKLLYADIDRARKKEIKRLLVFFSEVDTLDINTINWKQHFNQNNQAYQMLISVCYLVLKGLIQTTSAGTTRIMDFVDEQHMCHLYEKFILEYYRTEFPAIKAEASQIKWMLDDDNGSMLPIMKSDITLSYGDKILIIDAKYYAHTTQVQFDKHTIHSGNLYQIFTYVKNKEAELKELSHEVAGMLLYAKTDEEIQPDNEYWMSGNKIGVKTLDLSGDFDSIEKQLYAIAKDFFGDVVDTHFYLNARGCAGVGVRNGNLGFMLLAGSQISQKEPSSTCPEHIHRLREEYSDKMQNGVLMENVLFHSASAAASFLMMTNINGNTVWKTKEGTSLGEYRRKY